MDLWWDPWIVSDLKLNPWLKLGEIQDVDCGVMVL